MWLSWSKSQKWRQWRHGYQLIEGCHEQYRGLLFVILKRKTMISQGLLIFCGACDVDGSTDRVIALDQSSV